MDPAQGLVGLDAKIIDPSIGFKTQQMAQQSLASLIGTGVGVIKKAGDETDLKNAWAANTDANGVLNVNGFKNQLMQTNPDVAMTLGQKAAEQFQGNQNVSDVHNTNHLSYLSSKLDQLGGAVTQIQSLPPEQQDAAWGQVRDHAVEQGLITPEEAKSYPTFASSQPLMQMGMGMKQRIDAQLREQQNQTSQQNANSGTMNAMTNQQNANVSAQDSAVTRQGNQLINQGRQTALNDDSAQKQAYSQYTQAHQQVMSTPGNVDSDGNLTEQGQAEMNAINAQARQTLGQYGKPTAQGMDSQFPVTGAAAGGKVSATQAKINDRNTNTYLNAAMSATTQDQLNNIRAQAQSVGADMSAIPSTIEKAQQLNTDMGGVVQGRKPATVNEQIALAKLSGTTQSKIDSGDLMYRSDQDYKSTLADAAAKNPDIMNKNLAQLQAAAMTDPNGPDAAVLRSVFRVVGAKSGQALSMAQSASGGAVRNMQEMIMLAKAIVPVDGSQPKDLLLWTPGNFSEAIDKSRPITDAQTQNALAQRKQAGIPVQTISADKYQSLLKQANGNKQAVDSFLSEKHILVPGV